MTPLPGSALLGRLLSDLALGLGFLTRLPLSGAAVSAPGALARSLWSLPLVGALLGGLGALAYWAALSLSLPPLVAAALTLALLLAVTGCLHEDGLADTADGLGGGWSRERKLEIMRDSRLGTYGGTALAVSLLLRWSLLAALATPGAVAASLVAAEAASRALLPAAMALLPSARRQGMAAGAGRPDSAVALAAALLGLLALLLCLGVWPGLLAAALALVVAALWGWLGMRQIGGYTGDTLGALQQALLIAVLLAAVMTR